MPKNASREMPAVLVARGDGSLQPLEAPPPAPVETPKVEAPEDRQPAPSAGSTAAGPTGGDPGQPSGGAPPSIAQELSASLPLQPSQRGPDDKSTESGSAVVAKSMAPQLLSSPEFLNRLRIDERKLAVLNDLTQTSLNYLGFRGYIDKIRFWAWFVDAELVTSQAIGGLARRHALRAIEASSGATISQTAQKPNVVARNLWERGWKKKAVEQGQDIPEGE